LKWDPVSLFINENLTRLPYGVKFSGFVGLSS
jgi:hypothetical protein